jgi:hypothetical protein
MADATPVAANAVVDSLADASWAAARSAVERWADGPDGDRLRVDWAAPAERLRPDALDDHPPQGDPGARRRRAGLDACQPLDLLGAMACCPAASAYRLPVSTPASKDALPAC